MTETAATVKIGQIKTNTATDSAEGITMGGITAGRTEMVLAAVDRTKVVRTLVVATR